MDTTTYALLYCRVSSARQKQEGHGLESQEFRCKERAREKGYVYERTFFDAYTGGGDFMRRPAMHELLIYIDENPQKRYVVIFDDLKRFARDVIFHWQLRQEFRARNALVECLNFNFDETPEGEFIETILAAQGQLERKQNRRQVIQKQKARLEAGHWPFFPPQGYRHVKDPLHGKILVLSSAKAHLIREALEGFAAGRFQGQAEIAHLLQKHDFLNGRPVYLGTVQRLLTNVVYAGYVEYEPWGVTRRRGHHEALIDLRTYEAIQAKLCARSRPISRKVINEDFPLRRHVFCAGCRCPYTASWSRGRRVRYAYYRCKTQGCPNRNRHIPRSVMEEGLVIILKRAIPGAEALSLVRKLCERVWREKIGNVEAARATCLQQLEGIRQGVGMLAARAAHATTEAAAKAYEQRIADLMREEALVRERIATVGRKSEDGFGTALDVVFDALKDPYTTWQNGDVHDRRMLLKVLFAEPLVYDPISGFGTAILSLPFRVFSLLSESRFHLVDIVRKNWNQLYQSILDIHHQLRHHKPASTDHDPHERPIAA